MNTLDCQTCGACCGPENDRDTYVEFKPGEDESKIPVRFLSRGLHDSAMLTKRTKTNGVVCIALRGRISQKVWCAIYENRPSVCRDFGVGSSTCLETRRSVL